MGDEAKFPGPTRRWTLGAGLAAGALATARPALSAAAPRRLRLGFGTKLINTTFINLLLGGPLGTDAKAGFSLAPMPLGSLSNVVVALARGEIDFGVLAPSTVLPLYAKGELPPVVAFYEYTYPYKWDVAVLPGSPLKSYQDLRGKRIGVSNLGTTDFPVTGGVLRNLGIDPKTQVTWIAVGEGVSGGIALKRGAIDALAYYDTGFGQIEMAGIALRYLPRPKDVPMIGGFYVGARRDFLAKEHEVCVAFGRTIAMATDYILANPAAGVRAYLTLFPRLAPGGVDPEKAVAMVVKALQRRLTLFRPPYPGAALGSIHRAEWQAEANFMGLEIADVRPLFTNALIAACNDFDAAPIVAAAKAAKA